MMASDQSYGAMLNREIIVLSGPQEEQQDFLQSLVTNDVTRATVDQLVYAALLTPQGKYLSDFFVMRTEEGDFALDVSPALGEALEKRLSMYKLRRPIQLSRREASVAAIWGGESPENGFADPRDGVLGWRVYTRPEDALAQTAPGDYDLHRLKQAVPESGVDLIANDTYILEAGFERLGGVDFKKGCYVGQEIVARMKHKTDLRKKYALISLSDSVSQGETIKNHDKMPVGTVYSNRDGIGLALLRVDRVQSAESLEAGGIEIKQIPSKN